MSNRKKKGKNNFSTTFCFNKKEKKIQTWQIKQRRWNRKYWIGIGREKEKEGGQFCCFGIVPIFPQKITIGIWVSTAKEPFMKSEKSNRIMKLWLFPYNSVKTPSDLAK